MEGCVVRGFGFVVVLAGSLVVCGEGALAQSSKEDLVECKGMEDSAKTVMQSRQSDVPMSKLWEISEGSESDYVKEMYQMLIRNAYAQPRFSLEENQQKAVVDFQNEFFSACMRNAAKRKKKT